MEALSDSLCGVKIWYKFPYEDFAELKLLSEDQNFQKICLASVWIKSIELFLEKENNVEVGDGSHSDRDVSDVEGDRAVSDDEGDRVVGDGDRAVSDGEGDRAFGDGDRGDRAVNRDFVDMDARVEENLTGFVDEEEHDNCEDTPPNSDCEDAPRRYVRCKRGSGDIRLEQVFDSISEFKEAVIDYALKKGENIKFTRWGSEKSEVRCSIGGNSKFRIYCAYDDEIGKYMVKTFNDVHACTTDGFCKVLKSGIIAQLFLNDIRRDPTLKPKAMQQAIEERYTIVATPDQCRKAKGKTLKII
ncbi:hypothetical protein CARUB_v10001576mg [Capsella rubella]|uniref:Transposase MuDR plant domain-containing protein n=2 Tax=Capsella rubella TaxID=81985 RepID=R0FG29_9BRAS|nr:hypothetical protein CARUB_v10001576mg [Capsella rubella]